MTDIINKSLNNNCFNSISEQVQLSTACQQLLCTMKFNFQFNPHNVRYIDFTSCSCLMHCCTKDLSCRGRASLIFSVPPNPDMMLLRAMPAPLVLQIFEISIEMSFFDEDYKTSEKYCVPGTKEAGSPLRSHRIWLRYIEFTKRRRFTENRNKIFHK